LVLKLKHEETGNLQTLSNDFRLVLLHSGNQEGADLLALFLGRKRAALPTKCILEDGQAMNDQIVIVLINALFNVRQDLSKVVLDFLLHQRGKYRQGIGHFNLHLKILG
jgi:hypothetical protein